MGRDCTAAHYCYHDDPFLLPYNNRRKDDYLMSKLSGKRAARFILDQHPELFENNLIEMDPPIKAFMPTAAALTEDNASLALLDTYIAGACLNTYVMILA